MRWTLLIIAIVGSVLIAEMVVRSISEKETLAVEFVFDEGFKGPYVIYANQKDAEPIERTGKKLAIRVPESGVVRVFGKSPTQEWHTIEAKYKGGETISVDLINKYPLIDAVRSLGTVSDQDGNDIEEYYLGKEDEAVLFQNKNLSGFMKSTLGRVSER